jgi:siderophore synthetase component
MLQADKAYLKLSMHLMNTSSTRILAKHTVMNAAVVTKWLNQLVAEDAAAQALQIAFLGETVGVSLDHEVLQQRGYQHPHIYGGLGAIWRENVSQYLLTNQTAFPLNGVSYINTDGSILIDPWIKKYGAEAWTAQLIKVTVAPVLHLLFGHGVALECHAQNIVLVHEAGFPVKILLKDLHDGVRYSPKHLTRQDLIPNFYSLPAAHAALNRGSFIETEDTDGIRDMTVACLFFVAFADIAIFMQTHYHYPEAEFWQQVSDCVTEYQSCHPEHKARFELFDVFAPQTRIESLAKRRLFGDQVFPIKYINNPLAKSRV